MGERESGRVEGAGGVIYSRSCWRYQTWFAHHFTDILVVFTVPVGDHGLPTSQPVQMGLLFLLENVGGIVFPRLHVKSVIH